jgi:hypothetical protein
MELGQSPMELGQASQSGSVHDGKYSTFVLFVKALLKLNPLPVERSEYRKIMRRCPVLQRMGALKNRCRIVKFLVVIEQRMGFVAAPRLNEFHLQESSWKRSELIILCFLDEFCPILCLEEEKITPIKAIHLSTSLSY